MAEAARGVGTSPEFVAEAERIVARYPTARSALMPLLYLVQAEEGHVSREGMQRVADLLGIKTAEVEAVVTFYTMYHRPPCGRYVLSICTNLPCALAGGRRLFDAALERLGEQADHGVSDDGMVTVHEEECLAACDGAPVVQVNYANYERLTEESFAELVEALRRGEPPPPTRGTVPGDLRETSRVLAGMGRPGAIAGARTEPPTKLADVTGPSRATEPTGDLGRLGASADPTGGGSLGGTEERRG